MPLEVNKKLGQNWFIFNLVSHALYRHEADGKMPDKEHVYFDDTRKLKDVVREFGNSARAKDVATARKSWLRGNRPNA